MVSRTYVSVISVSVVLLAALSLAADDSVADAKAKELRKFQGTWVLLSGEKGGGPMPDRMVKSAKLVIKENKIKVSLNGKEDHEQEFEIDPGKSPKEISLTRELNGQKSTVLGIYSFDGKTLTLCGDDRGKV